MIFIVHKLGEEKINNRFSNHSIVYSVDEYTVENLTNFTSAELKIITKLVEFFEKNNQKLNSKKISVELKDLRMDNLQPVISRLLRRYSVIYDQQQQYCLNCWFDRITFMDNMIVIHLNRFTLRIIRHLLESFPNWQWASVIQFNYTSSIALYKLLVNMKRADPVIKISTLKRMILGKEVLYEYYSSFKTKILIPAVNEINGKSDIQIEFKEVLDRRKVGKIAFTIQRDNIVVDKIQTII